VDEGFPDSARTTELLDRMLAERAL
jgi:hypothetical protein